MEKLFGKKSDANVCRAGATCHKRHSQKSYQGVEKMGMVLTIAGCIGLALLVYLFYVLLRGEEL
jgi:K+-transporting ATPase KdpF subunit